MHKMKKKLIHIKDDSYFYSIPFFDFLSSCVFSCLLFSSTLLYCPPSFRRAFWFPPFFSTCVSCFFSFPHVFPASFSFHVRFLSSYFPRAFPVSIPFHVFSCLPSSPVIFFLPFSPQVRSSLPFSPHTVDDVVVFLIGTTTVVCLPFFKALLLYLALLVFMLG
jgi:hypothetical protein